MNIILILLIFIILFLVVVVYLTYDRFCYFSKRSIPCPPIPSVIFGHLPDLWSAKLYSEQLQKWTRQYGSVYGLFQGTRPVYVVSDIKFIEEVFITQFARFYSRGPHLGSEILGKEYDNILTTNTAEIWKRQRKILNPAYSGAKIRRLLPTIDTCINIFIERLASIQNGTVINVFEMFKRLTIDIICRSAFSIDTEVQYDENNSNIYMKKAEEVFADDFEVSYLGKMHRTLSYTPLVKICSFIFRIQQFFKNNKASVPAYLWLIGHMQEFIQQRYIDLSKKKSSEDLLQLMIDAIALNEDKLLPTELLSNVFITLLAGYESSATALGYCSYRLAMHQDIQEKLYEEIATHWSTDINSYDVLMSKLTYMDSFVREVFRIHPVAIHVVHRQCMEDTDVAGYDVRKGTLVYVDVRSLQFDQDLWGPEPVDEFHPERHSVKRHPLSLVPFGIGPRTCIGMRFALLEIKLCLARLIHEYRILPPSHEKYELNLHEGIVIAPEKVLIKLEKR